MHFNITKQFLLCKRPPATGGLCLSDPLPGLCPWTPLWSSKKFLKLNNDFESLLFP